MTFDHPTRDDIEALLRWYVDMGVDVAIDAAPHDRFAEALADRRAPADVPPEPVAPPPNPPLPSVRPVSSPSGHGVGAVSVDGAVRSAREAAEAAQTLDELRAALEAFDGCALRSTATRIAFSDGTPGARVMAVGEAPGAEEDRQGRPFCGPSGQLLDRMLAAIGLDRNQVYIANVVPWRPPGNRTPTPQEVATCMPFIARQIALADPEFLLCLGGPAAQSLLGVKEGIMRLRGRWRDFDNAGKPIKAMPMLHPAYLLRQPAHKKLAWADLRQLRKALDASP